MLGVVKRPRGSWPSAAARLAVVAALAATALGTSMRNIGPLAKMNDISIEAVMIGNSLAPDGSESTTLFQGDVKASEAFRTALGAEIEAHLKAGGMGIDSKSRNHIGFNVFGGKFLGSGCESQNFFMIEVWVTGPKDKRYSTERTILGVVDDDALAATIIKAAVSAVDEFLAQRKAFREAQRGVRPHAA